MEPVLERTTNVRGELRALVRLALPLIVARAGHNLMSVVDTIVAGKISADAIAAVGLAGASFFMVFVFPFGVMLGLDPLVSQAVGAGRGDRWRGGLVAARWLALVMVVPTVLLMLALPEFLACRRRGLCQRARQWRLGRNGTLPLDHC